MARLMYDSTNPFDIPRTAHAVAGYVDGLYAWSQAGWDYHGAPLKVRIAVNPATMNAHVLDVEQGDATIAQAVAWVKAQRALGKTPALYMSRGIVPAAEAAFRAAGMAYPLWWIAEWTGTSHELGGAIATQYDHPPHSGGHYDLSTVADYWPGIDPAPVPAPAPPPPAPTPPPPAPAPPPPLPGPIIVPINPPAAHASFWSFLAYVLGQGIPRVFNAVLAQLRRLADL